MLIPLHAKLGMLFISLSLSLSLSLCVSHYTYIYTSDGHKIDNDMKTGISYCYEDEGFQRDSFSFRRGPNIKRVTLAVCIILGFPLLMEAAIEDLLGFSFKL